HLVMTLRRMHEELPPESRAAQLLGAFEIERRLYLQLFNSLPTPGLVLTADGQILEVNPEGAELLGVPDAPSVRGRSLTEWAAESSAPRSLPRCARPSTSARSFSSRSSRRTRRGAPRSAAPRRCVPGGSCRPCLISHASGRASGPPSTWRRSWSACSRCNGPP